MMNSDSNSFYQLTVQGHLSQRWAQWLGASAVQITPNQEFTTIVVQVTDQAALRGVVNKLWDLNITVLTLHRKDNVRDLGVNNEN